MTLTGGGGGDDDDDDDDTFYEAATVLAAFVQLGHWFEMCRGWSPSMTASSAVRLTGPRRYPGGIPPARRHPAGR